MMGDINERNSVNYRLGDCLIRRLILQLTRLYRDCDMNRWILGMGLCISAHAAITDQAAFRGSIGITDTSDYLLDAYNTPINPTNNSMSYGIGLGYRLKSGFLFELDFIGSSNKYNLTTLDNACSGSGSPCAVTFCTSSGSTTTCTSTTMGAPATTTGSTVDLTGTTITKGTPTAGTSSTLDPTVNGTVTTTTTIVNYTGTSSSTTVANSGYVSVSTLMMNMIYQFSPETKFNPYIGYGLGYADTTAGFGITTTPYNTTSQSSTSSYYDSSDESTTVSSPTYMFISTEQADDGAQTLTKSISSAAYQWVIGSEIRFDLHNTVDLRMVKRYMKIPNVTSLNDTGTAYPGIGVTTTTGGVTTTTVSNVSASTTTFEIGLLYYA